MYFKDALPCVLLAVMAVVLVARFVRRKGNSPRMGELS